MILLVADQRKEDLRWGKEIGGGRGKAGGGFAFGDSIKQCLGFG